MQNADPDNWTVWCTLQCAGYAPTYMHRGQNRLLGVYFYHSSHYCLETGPLTGPRNSFSARLAGSSTHKCWDDSSLCECWEIQIYFLMLRASALTHGVNLTRYRQASSFEIPWNTFLLAKTRKWNKNQQFLSNGISPMLHIVLKINPPQERVSLCRLDWLLTHRDPLPTKCWA